MGLEANSGNLGANSVKRETLLTKIQGWRNRGQIAPNEGASRDPHSDVVVNPSGDPVIGQSNIKDIFEAGNRPKDHEATPEVKKVTGVRSVKESDFDDILLWWTDKSTRDHLDPEPPYFKDGSRETYAAGHRALIKYLSNGGEPSKLLAAVAVNSEDKALAFGAIRWRGRKEEIIYAGGHDSVRVPFIEKVTTDPELQAVNQKDNTETGPVRYHAGSALVASLLNHAFSVGYNPRKTGGGERPQPSVRAWVMVDVKNPPIKFWEQTMGFKHLNGDYNRWKEAQGITTDRGNAYKYELIREQFEVSRDAGQYDGLIFPITVSDIFSSNVADLAKPNQA